MKLIFKYLKQNKKTLFAALGVTAVWQLASLADPQIFRILVDNYASKTQALSFIDFVKGVVFLLVASALIALVARTTKHLQSYYVNVTTQRVGARLYTDAISHTLSLPYYIFTDQRSGEILEKIQKARLDAQTLITSFINVVFLSLVGLLAILIYGFIVHPFIGLAFLAVPPILGGTNFLISKKVKTIQSEIVSQTTGLAGSTTETLRNIELVKSLGLGNQEISRLDTVNEKILELEFKKIRLVRILNFIQDTLINTTRILILFLLLWLIFEKIVTVGQFFTLFIYSFFIFNPLSDLGDVATQYQEAKASMEAVQGILNTPSEKIPADPQKVGSISTIQFKKVYFSYSDTKNPSVKDVSFILRSGETSALVGPSGSGKTTIVKLILGLYHPTKGKILFNGTDADKIDYAELKNRAGYVSQETQLFAGTIRENLIFVKPDASDKECLKVIEQSSATSILKRGKQGLNTRIGEGGIKVSGGERQRLAIARALLRNPEIIIFDEATSNLDSLTEKEITKTIREISKLRRNLITLIVAHRLSTIQHVDKIYVLEKGKIIEQGSHPKLLALGNLYSALWREQIGQKSL